MGPEIAQYEEALETHLPDPRDLGRHITPEAVQLSVKSANSETGAGMTSRP